MCDLWMEPPKAHTLTINLAIFATFLAFLRPCSSLTVVSLANLQKRPEAFACYYMTSQWQAEWVKIWLTIMAAATTDIAPTEINPHLVFNPQKNQFQWNSDLKTLRDFWIAELEGGDENNLVSVNSNGNTEVLKFESVTVNFYSSTKTLQVQGSQKDQYVKKLRNIVEKGTKSQDTLIEVTSNSGSAEITEPAIRDKSSWHTCLKGVLLTNI